MIMFRYKQQEAMKNRDLQVQVGRMSLGSCCDQVYGKNAEGWDP